ncbi:MAG: hypothetical protein CW742_14195, partial [Methanoregula sp.]
MLRAARCEREQYENDSKADDAGQGLPGAYFCCHAYGLREAMIKNVLCGKIFLQEFPTGFFRVETGGSVPGEREMVS